MLGGRNRIGRLVPRLYTSLSSRYRNRSVLRVALVQRVLPHYRVPFHRALHSALQPDIELTLYFGHEYPGTVPATVEFNEPWAHTIRNRYLFIRESEIVWQSCLRDLSNFDLVIVEQANRLLLNYALFARRYLLPGGPKIALWAHGRNWQSSSRTRLREYLKLESSKLADWWFAYSISSAQVLTAAGYPGGRITVVNNAIDSTDLARAYESVSPSSLQRLRELLGISPDDRVGIYCGGLHPGKQLEFLLEAVREYRRRDERFHLLVVGHGPSAAVLKAAGEPWIHLVGPVFGGDRAVYFSLAHVTLVPAQVGLVIVDTFVTQTPLITTDDSGHGPEISYLESGSNGLVASHDARAYADAMERYFSSPQLQSTLRQGCAKSAPTYTVERMAARFADGIRDCLRADDERTAQKSVISR